jgi:hypothetical protein
MAMAIKTPIQLNELRMAHLTQMWKTNAPSSKGDAGAIEAEFSRSRANRSSFGRRTLSLSAHFLRRCPR